jgi:penicillin amidase
VTLAPAPAAASGCVTLREPGGVSFLDCSNGGTFNILPAGEGSDINTAQFAAGQQPAHWTDQLAMYGNLKNVAPNLQASQLGDYYKSSAFGLPHDQVASSESPHDGLLIERDKQFGVPHIYGRTRYAAEFGAGYAAAEDRLFFMDVLRHLGRGELASFAGGDPGNRALDAEQWAVAPYTEADLQTQADS